MYLWSQNNHKPTVVGHYNFYSSKHHLLLQTSAFLGGCHFLEQQLRDRYPLVFRFQVHFYNYQR